MTVIILWPPQEEVVFHLKGHRVRKFGDHYFGKSDASVRSSTLNLKTLPYGFLISSVMWRLLSLLWLCTFGAFPPFFWLIGRGFAHLVFLKNQLFASLIPYIYFINFCQDLKHILSFCLFLGQSRSVELTHLARMRSLVQSLPGEGMGEGCQKKNEQQQKSPYKQKNAVVIPL